MHGLPPQQARERIRNLWRTDRSNDPIRQSINELSARAAYHRQMGSPQGIVRAYEEFADHLRVACRTIREHEVDLNVGKALTPRGTGRPLEKIARDGKIRLDAVPLREGSGPIHALRASRLLAEGTNLNRGPRGTR